MSGSETRKLFARPSSLMGLPFAYCPGCSHGILQKLSRINKKERALPNFHTT